MLSSTDRIHGDKHLAHQRLVPSSAAFGTLMLLFNALGCSQLQESNIVRMARAIDSAQIKIAVESLADFGTRNTMSSADHPTRGIGAARRWLVSQLENINKANGGRLTIEDDRFLHGPDGNRIMRETEIVNVVATLPGTQAESRDRIYVVSAHYDSMCNDPKDPDCDAPGADDDASGCAVVLELARIMSREQFDATIVFMFVAGEEQGLIGSRHWAKAAKDKGLNIAGMFTNDIVGASRGPSGVDHRGRVRVFSEGVSMTASSEEMKLLQSTGYLSDAPARQLARYIDESAARFLGDFDVVCIFRRDRFLRGGDHTAFSEQGYAAVRFTEFEENYDHQHQTPRIENGRAYGDWPKHCDAEYIADVARANLVALAGLAMAPASPRDVKIITSRLTNDTTLKWTRNSEPDLAGYDIVWRTTDAPYWQRSLSVGDVGEFTMPLSKDNVIFGVAAFDREGHRSPASVPMPARE